MPDELRSGSTGPLPTRGVEKVAVMVHRDDKVTEQAREYGEKAQAAAKEFKPFVEKSMKEQPMTTLAGAAVIGFVLGALWKK